MFLDDERARFDNDRSARVLRRVVLGRKIYVFTQRFIRRAEAAANIAVLYSLVASCEARGYQLV